MSITTPEKKVSFPLVIYDIEWIFVCLINIIIFNIYDDDMIYDYYTLFVTIIILLLLYYIGKN